MSELETKLITLKATWIGLMRSFPRDGWDGAGDAIARHDRRVMELEAELDALDSDWHDDQDMPRRSHDPRKP